MPNSINLLSPSFRDYLLLKNLVTDTVVDNGLESLLGGIGKPTEIETLPNAVQPSNSISNTGPVYQELNTILNQYQGTENDYTQVDIVLNNSINSTITQSGPYTSNNELLNGQFYYNGNLVTSESIRKDLTTKNVYIDKEKQTVINLNTQPVAAYQNLTSYIDENNNLNVGGPSTQILDVIGGIVGGQGVGITGGGVVANDDIRATLLGRVLGATGVINDTPLGNIGGQQLLAHVGYNASFGLQQETLGTLNLNPLTLLQGKNLVTLNYSITVPKNSVGKVLNFAANVFGVQSPVSLLQQSIFSFDDKGGVISIGNIERGNEIIKNSGKGQVNSLFNSLRANTNVPNPNGTTLRQGYAPGYTDDRKVKGENVGDGLNPTLYARDNGKGEIIDFLNGKENSPISSGNYDRPNQIISDGWSEDYRGFYNSVDYPLSLSPNDTSRLVGLGLGVFKYKNAFGWSDDYNNKPEDVKDFNQETQFNNKKTLLYKTRKIFETNRMQTLVSGHGVKDDVESQIQSSVSRVGNFVSKGSGVLSYNALINGVSDDPAKVFCRTWTTYDRYDAVFDLQKSRGLYGGNKNSVIFRRNVEFSVLENNGFARVAPYKTDKMAQVVDAEGVTAAGNKMKTYRGDTDNKRYMFSIENLAWNDNLVNLLPCEVGPGDPLSNHRGRIMWFPPYDINFSESTSASWDKHNFIGRGEPIYTYNNTERSGNLSWKIIIDHPNYLNFIGKATGITPENYDDFLASYFAGCIPQEDLQAILTQEEIVKTEVVNVEKKPEIKKEPDVGPPSFDVYFPNDVYDINKYPDYEDGKCRAKNASLLFTLTGHTNTLNDARFSPDGTKVVTSSFDKTARIWDTTNGKSLFKLSGHTGTLGDANFSPDGTKVVTASDDKTAKIWDVSNGSLIKNLIGHASAVYDANFNSDGTKVVTASKDGNARIWDVSNGNSLFTLIGHTGSVSDARFSPDGTKVVTSSTDKTAKIWDVSNGNLLFTLVGHTETINDVRFSPDGTKVVTSSTDKTAKIWDVSNGNLLFTLVGHTGGVNDAMFSPDGIKIVTASKDKTARIWDVSNGNLLFTLVGHILSVNDAMFSPDGIKVVTASDDGNARVWDVSNGSLIKNLIGHTGSVYDANFSPDGIKIVTASKDKTAKIWDYSKTECVIDRTTNVTGEGNGIDTYFELCYQFKVNGKDQWSSEKCTSSNGPKGGDGRIEPDRTNFGLNASGTTKDFKCARIGDKRYALGFRDPEYAKDLKTYLSSKCQSCKIEVVGYASNVGTFGEDRNNTLSKLRAESVVDWLKNNVLNDTPFADRLNIKSAGEGATEGRGKCEKSPSSRNKDYTKSLNDTYGCKANRYVTVTFVPDPALAQKEEPPKEPEKVPEPPKTPNLPISRFYSECDYFEKLSLTDPTTYDTIRQKIKYFQPAFHSTTPEGFNSRLTFLQQCMRQGPTLGAGVTNNPNNLAFGRPPVCILRIGDFYHTKIIIENLNFTFEPLVWDLNPEGIGVQPMICNVDMSFSFIGGSSLRGPINRLQNAVSFNYYANTEIYDPRADTIKITEGSSSGVTVDGIKTIAADYNLSPEAQKIAGLTSQVEPNLNQINQNNNANAGSQPLNDGTTGSISGSTGDYAGDDAVFQDALVFKNYMFKVGYAGTKLIGDFKIVSATKLTKPYDARLSLITTSGTIDIATFKIGTGNSGIYQSVKDGWRDILMTESQNDLSPSPSNVKKSIVVFQVEILDFKYKFYDDRAIAQFECPEEDILLGDIVSTSDWDYILKDPCCACWPNGTGTKNITINGIKCPTSGCTS
jgi:WD40 repeat protein